MTTVLTVIEWWAAISFVLGPIYLALLATKRVGFHVPVRK